jgi:hypothetical protein
MHIIQKNPFLLHHQLHGLSHQSLSVYNTDHPILTDNTYIAYGCCALIHYWFI